MENELELKPGRVRAIKKQLDRCFNEKNFPLKIDFNTEGLMLIYTRS